MMHMYLGMHSAIGTTMELVDKTLINQPSASAEKQIPWCTPREQASAGNKWLSMSLKKQSYKISVAQTISFMKEAIMRKWL